MNLTKRNGEITVLHSNESLKEKIILLNKNLGIYKKYKKEITRHAQKLEDKYNKKVFSYAEYEYLLNKYLKGQSLEYWLEHYDSQEKKTRKKIAELKLQKPGMPLERRLTHLEEKTRNNLFVYGIAMLALILLGLSAPLTYQTFHPNDFTAGLIIDGKPVDCANGCMFIKNRAGSNLAIFDSQGNLLLKGELSNTPGSPDGHDFVIKDKSGNNKAWMDGTNGNIRISGTKFEKNNDYCRPPSGSFVVEDNSGKCLAYIDSIGNLWLKGSLMQNSNIQPKEA